MKTILGNDPQSFCVFYVKTIDGKRVFDTEDAPFGFTCVAFGADAEHAAKQAKRVYPDLKRRDLYLLPVEHARSVEAMRAQGMTVGEACAFFAQAFIDALVKPRRRKRKKAKRAVDTVAVKAEAAAGRVVAAPGPVVVPAIEAIDDKAVIAGETRGRKKKAAPAEAPAAEATEFEKAVAVLSAAGIDLVKSGALQASAESPLLSEPAAEPVKIDPFKVRRKAHDNVAARKAAAATEAVPAEAPKLEPVDSVAATLKPANPFAGMPVPKAAKASAKDRKARKRA
jgi:hypothetical protein